MINKEMHIFDKKAEEATMDLLLAQEELDATRDAKKTLDQNMSAMKFDLFGYLKNLKKYKIEIQFKKWSYIIDDNFQYINMYMGKSQY